MVRELDYKNSDLPREHLDLRLGNFNPNLAATPSEILFKMLKTERLADEFYSKPATVAGKLSYLRHNCGHQVEIDIERGTRVGGKFFFKGDIAAGIRNIAMQAKGAPSDIQSFLLAYSHQGGVQQVGQALCGTMLKRIQHVEVISATLDLNRVSDALFLQNSVLDVTPKFYKLTNGSYVPLNLNAPICRIRVQMEITGGGSTADRYLDKLTHGQYPFGQVVYKISSLNISFASEANQLRFALAYLPALVEDILSGRHINVIEQSFITSLGNSYHEVELNALSSPELLIVAWDSHDRCLEILANHHLAIKIFKLAPTKAQQLLKQLELRHAGSVEMLARVKQLKDPAITWKQLLVQSNGDFIVALWRLNIGSYQPAKIIKFLDKVNCDRLLLAKHRELLHTLANKNIHLARFFMKKFRNQRYVQQFTSNDYVPLLNKFNALKRTFLKPLTWQQKLWSLLAMIFSFGFYRGDRDYQSEEQAHRQILRNDQHLPQAPLVQLPAKSPFIADIKDGEAAVLPVQEAAIRQRIIKATEFSRIAIEQIETLFQQMRVVDNNATLKIFCDLLMNDWKVKERFITAEYIERLAEIINSQLTVTGMSDVVAQLYIKIPELRGKLALDQAVINCITDNDTLFDLHLMLLEFPRANLVTDISKLSLAKRSIKQLVKLCDLDESQRKAVLAADNLYALSADDKIALLIATKGDGVHGRIVISPTDIADCSIASLVAVYRNVAGLRATINANPRLLASIFYQASPNVVVDLLNTYEPLQQNLVDFLGEYPELSYDLLHQQAIIEMVLKQVASNYEFKVLLRNNAFFATGLLKSYAVGSEPVKQYVDSLGPVARKLLFVRASNDAVMLALSSASLAQSFVDTCSLVVRRRIVGKLLNNFALEEGGDALKIKNNQQILLFAQQNKNLIAQSNPIRMVAPAKLLMIIAYRRLGHNNVAPYYFKPGKQRTIAREWGLSEEAVAALPAALTDAQELRQQQEQEQKAQSMTLSGLSNNGRPRSNSIIRTTLQSLLHEMGKLSVNNLGIIQTEPQYQRNRKIFNQELAKPNTCARLLNNVEKYPNIAAVFHFPRFWQTVHGDANLRKIMLDMIFIKEPTQDIVNFGNVQHLLNHSHPLRSTEFNYSLYANLYQLWTSETGGLDSVGKFFDNNKILIELEATILSTPIAVAQIIINLPLDNRLLVKILHSEELLKNVLNIADNPDLLRQCVSKLCEDYTENNAVVRYVLYEKYANDKALYQQFPVEVIKILDSLLPQEKPIFLGKLDFRTRSVSTDSAASDDCSSLIKGAINGNEDAKHFRARRRPMDSIFSPEQQSVDTGKIMEHGQAAKMHINFFDAPLSLPTLTESCLPTITPTFKSKKSITNEKIEEDSLSGNVAGNSIVAT